MYPIVVYGEGSIELPKLFVYSLLRQGADKERVKLRQLMDQLNNALEAQSKLLPELADEVNRLKREIRLITKGVPLTEPLDAVSSQPLLKSDPNFNQQQYDALTLLLKKAYRLVANIVHPDKGGSHEAFDEVRNAYLNRDLQALTDLYLTITKGRNLYWQQSDEGIAHVSAEYERPKVFAAKIKALPVYAIARLHIAGHIERASVYMEVHLKSEIASLLQELNYLGTQNG